MLYHIEITLPTRDEYPGARRERRTFVRKNRHAANKRATWLAERFPGCPITVKPVAAHDRSPVTL